MLFSVLIANYNNSRFLEQAIQSVIAQTYPDWEIVLVDDGSEDDFDAAIKPYKDHPQIRYYKNPANQGCGYTKNKCAFLAEGELMGFLDPDDYLAPNALEVMVNEHIKLADHSLISSTHYICNENGIPTRIAEYPRPLPPDTPYLLLGDGRIHAFATFKKIAYLQTTGISPMLEKAVDQDLYYKLEETGPVSFINMPLYYYRIHDGAISNAGKGKQALLWHYKVIEQACLRRIEALKKPDTQSVKMRRQYRMRYFKILVMHNIREHKWLKAISSFAQFSIVGGWKNVFSYLWKLPRNGSSQLRKSFIDVNEVKA